jgi:hypothetical protein
MQYKLVHEKLVAMFPLHSIYIQFLNVCPCGEVKIQLLLYFHGIGILIWICL